MASSGGIWAPIAVRMFRHAFKKATKLVEARISQLPKSVERELQPILIRSTPRQPIHPAAIIRQSKGRWYTTHSTINAAVRRFMSSAPTTGIKYDRTKLPGSATAVAVSKLTGRTPFASTLRPNLTGGAFPRTAGGYSTGGGRAGGARYFSHTPAAPAQVIQNVSQAVRAFWLTGQRAQYDGCSTLGEKRYRATSQLQNETSRKIDTENKLAPGSFIDFHINPTVTALTPLNSTRPFDAAAGYSAPTLNTEGFMDVLSVDFSRCLKELAVVMNDLKRLSLLGDLPITMEGQSVLRVRFPGCDIHTVEHLCDELDIRRGVVFQDDDFDNSCGSHVALMFPYAPGSEHTLSSPGRSLRSEISHDFEDFDMIDKPWLQSSEGYESMDDISESESIYFSKYSAPKTSSDYEGLEGIYRFIEECDNLRRI